MSSLITLYLVLVIALPLAVGLVVGSRSLPEGRRCSQCGTETFRLQSRPLAWLSLLFRTEFHRRWCVSCGWVGTVRLQAERASSIASLQIRGPRAGAPSSQTLEIGNLEVDGRPWRVLLQSWCDVRSWYGRILFVGASGRLCADPGDPFSGRSYHDVLGQALGLSEQMLARRLRQVASE